MSNFFTNPSLVPWWIAAGLIVAPFVIHLINLLRHRRVRWAAMDFLMASQKRNRNWIRLKQLLLLLLRMAAITAIVLMMFGPQLADRWSRLFGGGKTHHIVLLDDSYSMGDDDGFSTALEKGSRAIDALVQRAMAQPTPQRFTLLRFSDALQGNQPEILAATMDDTFRIDLDKRIGNVRESHFAGGLLAAVQSLQDQVQPQPNESRIVYLVSDFRQTDWQDIDALQQDLASLTESAEPLQLIRCAKQSRRNLTLSDLRPLPGARAAGVQLKYLVEVTNHDNQSVQDVTVNITSRMHNDAKGTIDEVPLASVRIDEIEAGATASRKFPVMFPVAGDHEVVASLSSDAVSTDNRRFSVVQVLPTVPVLIVDGQLGSLDGRFLQIVLSPSAKVHTGLRPKIVSPDFLRNEPLQEYRTIFFVNIERLDVTGVDAVEYFVRSGGGAVFFVGPHANKQFFNDSLYREGDGIFPLPLAGQAASLSNRAARDADISVDLTHPVFKRVFGSGRNQFLSAIHIDRYWAASKQWSAEAAATEGVQVLATLHNGAPLIVEKSLDEGRVVALLTTAAPTWNNWARNNPSFVIAMLELQTYLSPRDRSDERQLVGTPLAIELDAEQFEDSVQFNIPRGDGWQLLSGRAEKEQATDEFAVAKLDTTGQQGIYEATLTSRDGTATVQRYAYNVAPSEGNLAMVSNQQIANSLADIPHAILNAADYRGLDANARGTNLGEHWLFFAVLLALLLLEQIVAYSASFHTPRLATAR